MKVLHPFNFRHHPPLKQAAKDRKEHPLTTIDTGDQKKKKKKKKHLDANN